MNDRLTHTYHGKLHKKRFFLKKGEKSHWETTMTVLISTKKVRIGKQAPGNIF